MIPIYKILAGYYPKFKKKVMPHKKISKGILNSEAFAFCALANYFQVDLIIESGIYNGGSTEVWCKYFTRRTFMNITPVTSFDVKILPEAVTRLLPYSNITMTEGDSIKEIPEMINSITNGTIAVFIDGPKNKRGVALAYMCLQFPQVKLVAVHDMCRIFYNQIPCIGRDLMDAMPGVDKFYTDHPEFVNQYKKLDGNFADTPCEKYTYDSGGYGPTLGLAWKGA